MKILTTDAAINQPANLGGRKVALSKGTTSEKLFTQMRDAELDSLQLVSYASNLEAFKALQAGQVVAFPQDDILLMGMLATTSDAQRFRLTDSYLSVEPYAIMVRKGDGPLLAVVDQTLRQLYSSGQINAIYERWFNTEKIKLPMSRLLRDSFTRPTKEAGFARVLGHSL